MRILIVSWEYPPVLEGGLGRHVFKLSQQLACDGHEVHVLTRGPASLCEGDETGHEPVHVHRVEIPDHSLDIDEFMPWVGQLNALLAARGDELLDSYSFDLVHSHDWLVADASERLARRAGIPWLVTVHATEFGRHNGWVRTEPQRTIHLTERQMVRSADEVLTCSEYMAAHVRRVFGSANVLSIPNGIDTVDLAFTAGIDVTAFRERFASPDQPLVAMVGRLVYEKGFHVALEALAALSAQQPEIRFVLAGTGTAEAELRAQAAGLGLDPAIFLGRVDDATLHALYHAADVTVVPSLYEPFGIVPLEAMASGCPVIVSDTGGLREVVPDSAVRVPPDNVNALVTALTEVLADPQQRTTMTLGGLEHITAYDWSAVAARTAAVYAELVPAQPPVQV